VGVNSRVQSRAVRIAPWRPDPAFVHLMLAARDAQPLQRFDLRRQLDQLKRLGYRGVVTAALAPPDHAVFLEAGFRIIERLHLLQRELGPDVTRGPRQTRRARRKDRITILAVDRAAFDPFWQLDETMLVDALTATRTARLRVIEGPDGQVIGYAVCGRTGPRGYVQRLAVHPDHQGQGVGTSLLADGLAWLARWGAHDALVNTQSDNHRSLGLYRRAGFELQPGGLAVLRLEFGRSGQGDRRQPQLGVLRTR
jgi:ribosomal protein S18 acetylase RimI-like enzyme